MSRSTLLIINLLGFWTCLLGSGLQLIDALTYQLRSVVARLESGWRQLPPFTNRRKNCSWTSWHDILAWHRHQSTLAVDFLGLSVRCLQDPRVPWCRKRSAKTDFFLSFPFLFAFIFPFLFPLLSSLPLSMQHWRWVTWAKCKCQSSGWRFS